MKPSFLPQSLSQFSSKLSSFFLCSGTQRWLPALCDAEITSAIVKALLAGEATRRFHGNPVQGSARCRCTLPSEMSKCNKSSNCDWTLSGFWEFMLCCFLFVLKHKYCCLFTHPDHWKLLFLFANQIKWNNFMSLNPTCVSMHSIASVKMLFLRLYSYSFNLCSCFSRVFASCVHSVRDLCVCVCVCVSVCVCVCVSVGGCVLHALTYCGYIIASVCQVGDYL